MRILCVCSRGNCRSVATRRAIFELEKGHEALACGAKWNGGETLEMLSRWANIILLAEPQLIVHIPSNFQYKVNKDFSLGPDIWDDPWNINLKKKVGEQLRRLNL